MIATLSPPPQPLPEGVPARGDIDVEATSAELDRVAKAAGSAKVARPEVLKILKDKLALVRRRAENYLSASGDGRATARMISDAEDDLVRVLHRYVLRHVVPLPEAEETAPMAIAATGGFGRGLLAPGSDIDLLFLLPPRAPPLVEKAIEAILLFLWDLGQKVGHATRTADQCVKLATQDMTIRTALLDLRFILGDWHLVTEIERRLEQEVFRPSVRPFIEAKMAERDGRHARTGESRYRVEPNIKDGKGGLRDLHTLHWLAKYTTGDDPSSGAVHSGLFSRQEASAFRRCETFLWTVRCHLHFLTGRAEERLTFDVQPAMAERLGYRAHHGLSAVERFMKHYFLVAKEVGELTGALCSQLEMQQLKSAPTMNSLIESLGWRLRTQVRTRTEFRFRFDRIDVADTQVFNRDPVNLIRIFTVMHGTGALLHPNAARLIRRSLRLIDDTLRNDPEANRLFLELLTATTSSEVTLRGMNEVGVLGRFIPDFGRVISMMQFNMYHHYTVDEHLLRTVGELAAIEAGSLRDILPLSTRVIASIQSRRPLYVAAFLHDIGKGRVEDHSLVGARVARELGPRLGLTAAETETTIWLIEQHLTMSNIAQSRDLSDRRTIADFAKIVETPERLKLLLLLTVADIRAVGPGTWNGWKGQLLRQLYYEAEPLVAGGHTAVSRKSFVAHAQDEFKRALILEPQAEVERFIARVYPDYWMKTALAAQLEHFRLLKKADASKEPLVTGYSTDAFNSMTELTVIAPNHPRLLSLFAGACAAAGANIIVAIISTTRDGLALDTFLLQREFQSADDEARRMRRIEELISGILKGRLHLKTLLERRRPPEPRMRAFRLAPNVVIDNTLSDGLTVIEVSGLDRPGLLHALTSAISDLSLDITSAHITTFGEKAVDVFYVTDLTSRKIDSEARKALIRQRLEEVFVPKAEASPPA